jgi:hypothetical protein
MKAVNFMGNLKNPKRCVALHWQFSKLRLAISLFRYEKITKCDLISIAILFFWT